MTSGHMARIAMWGILGFLLIQIFPTTVVEAQHDDSSQEQGFLGSVGMDRTILVYGLGDSVASGHGLSGAEGDCVRAPGAYPLLATLTCSLLHAQLYLMGDS